MYHDVDNMKMVSGKVAYSLVSPCESAKFPEGKARLTLEEVYGKYSPYMVHHH